MSDSTFRRGPWMQHTRPCGSLWTGKYLHSLSSRIFAPCHCATAQNHIKQNVDWKKFALTAVVLTLGASLLGRFIGQEPPHQGQQAQVQPARLQVRVVASSQSSEGATEANLTPEFAQALEKHAVAQIGVKLQAVAKEAGIASPEARIQSNSTIVETQGKKLVVIRYEINSSSRGVEVLGIAGPTLNSVMCVRDSLEEILLTSGPCAAKIQEVHDVHIGG